jgi:hypothetical protein
VVCSHPSRAGAKRGATPQPAPAGVDWACTVNKSLSADVSTARGSTASGSHNCNYNCAADAATHRNKQAQKDCQGRQAIHHVYSRGFTRPSSGILQASPVPQGAPAPSMVATSDTCLRTEPSLLDITFAAIRALCYTHGTRTSKSTFKSNCTLSTAALLPTPSAVCWMLFQLCLQPSTISSCINNSPDASPPTHPTSPDISGPAPTGSTPEPTMRPGQQEVKHPHSSSKTASKAMLMRKCSAPVPLLLNVPPSRPRMTPPLLLSRS